MFSFVNWDRFLRDVRAWEKQLPYFDAVCGIPRSGVFPASYLAMQRNIRLVELDELIADPATAISKANLRSNNPAVNRPVGNKLLIVDDSSTNQSFTVNKLKAQLKDQTSLEISYGAVYRESVSSAVDYAHRDIPKPRMFEWNWLRHYELRYVLFDMDGVLCEDWLHRPEEEHDPEFENHVMNSKPLFVPEVPIMGIVTSRLEKYREKTEAWLAKHKIQYSFLEMHPAKTPQERRAAADHAKRKAMAYNFWSSKGAILFAESDRQQASSIAFTTGKPVLLANDKEPLQLINI